MTDTAPPAQAPPGGPSASDGPSPDGTSPDGTAPSGPSRARRAVRRAVAALVVLALLTVVAVAGIAWYFSGVALAVDHSAFRPHLVQRVHDGTVQLGRDADGLSAVPGRYGLTWDGGHGTVGPVQSSDARSVVRPYTPVDGTPAIGTDAWVDPDYYAGDPSSALSLDHEDVQVPTDLGPMPAWYVPGAAPTGTWVVFVHGHNGSRQESLRYLTTWHDLGLPVLVPTYRNDVGAPASPDGRSHLGDTEWRDVAAAVRLAKERGARDVVLAGWSMGGAISMRLLDDPATAATVRGVVLDSPVLDWRDTFASQGSDRGLPGWLTGLAARTVSLRAGIDLDAFDRPARAGALEVPVLLFHSDADDYVPDGPSKALAAARPDLVTYVDVPGARHTRAWNVDPQEYERRMTSWLRSVGAVAPAVSEQA